MRPITLVLWTSPGDPKCISNGMLEGFRRYGREAILLPFRSPDLQNKRRLVGIFTRGIVRDSIVLMPKGAYLNPKQIQEFRTHRPDCRLVYWTADSIGCGPRNGITDGGLDTISAFNEAIVSGFEGCKLLRDKGYGGRLSQIYQGFRREVWNPVSEYETPLRQVSFLGKYYPGDGGRRRILEHVRGRRYGLVHIPCGTWLEDAAGIYRASSINLNLVCGEIISNRVIRILGSRGFCLTPDIKDTLATYQPGVHLGTFKNGDVNDLSDKIDYYFENPSVVKQIAENGYAFANTRDWITQSGKILSFLDGETICDGAANNYVG